MHKKTCKYVTLIVTLLIFILLNVYMLAKEKKRPPSSVSDEVVHYIQDDYKLQKYKFIKEDNFLDLLLSMVGNVPFSTEDSNIELSEDLLSNVRDNKVKEINYQELIDYTFFKAIGIKFSNIPDEDLTPVNINNLRVGDIGIDESSTTIKYGIMVGLVEESPVFVNLSELPILKDMPTGMVSLSFLKEQRDELILSMPPVSYTKFLRIKGCSYSSGKQINLTTLSNNANYHPKVFNKLSMSIKQIGESFIKNDNSSLVEKLNLSYISKLGYQLNKEAFFHYLDSIFYSEEYLKVEFILDSYSKQKGYYLCDISIFDTSISPITKISTSIISIFDDGSYLPCIPLDVEKLGSYIGLVPIYEGETIIEENCIVDDVNDQQSIFTIIKDSEGNEVIRGDGYELTLPSQLMEPIKTE